MLRSALVCALVALTLPILNAADTPVAQELDWCSLTEPAQVSANTPFEISITVKNAPDKAKFATVHLHYADKNGAWKGYLEAGAAQPLTVNKQQTWRLTFTSANVGTVHPIIFLSENGDWSTLVQRANAQAIPVK